MKSMGQEQGMLLQALRPDREGQTRIAAVSGVRDSIRIFRVEQDNMVGIGDGTPTVRVSYEESTVWHDEPRGRYRLRSHRIDARTSDDIHLDIGGRKQCL